MNQAREWRAELTGEEVLAGLLAVERDGYVGRIAAAASPGGILAALADAGQDRKAFKMDFSLGLLGDLAWMLLPEIRQAMVSHITYLFQSAVDAKREPLGLLNSDVAQEVRNLLEPAFDEFLANRDLDAENLDLVDRCCRFLLAGMSFRSEGGDYIAERLEAEVLCRLSDQHIMVIREVEPQLADVVLSYRRP